MKITVEATGKFETVNGVQARLWKGKTESGIEVQCWIALVQVHKDQDQTEFLRELQAVKPERQLVSFDMRMV
jgi:hypothetical protein